MKMIRLTNPEVKVWADDQGLPDLLFAVQLFENAS
jgi:hypothetical protein